MLELISTTEGLPLTPSLGYRIYGAIARHVPELHDRPGWALILQRHRLGIRCEPELSGVAAKLSGLTIGLGRQSLKIGVSQVKILEPHPILYAPIVTIKGAIELADLTAAARAQLDSLGIDATLAFVDRRAIDCASYQVVGYSCAAICKTPEASIALQTHGVGGRRRMGGGVFVKGAIVPHRSEDL